MNTVKKILIPVDFSESSQAAIKYVLGMTKNDSTVKCNLIYIAPDGSSENEIDDIHRQLKDIAFGYFVPAHIEINYYVRTGELNQVLLQAKKELETDLIIMGTAGGNSDASQSNTSLFIKEADCPVLVIPENTGEFGLKNIALALDNEEIDDSSSLSILHDIARWYDAKIHLLTVEKGEQKQAFNKNEDTLEYYLETLDYHHSFPQNTDIELGLRNYVDEKGIDILAIMPRNHAKNTKPSEGKLTNILALNSTRPLLVID